MQLTNKKKYVPVEFALVYVIYVVKTRNVQENERIKDAFLLLGPQIQNI